MNLRRLSPLWILSFAIMLSGCSTVPQSSADKKIHPLRAVANFFGFGRHDTKMTELEPLGDESHPTSAVVVTGDESFAGSENVGGGFSAVNRYALRREGSQSPAGVAASRVQKGADYRVLYFPGEQTENYAVEGSRELLRVRNEEMAKNPFDPVAPGGGNMVFSESADGPARSARSYVAPDKDAVRAAFRFSGAPGDVVANPGIMESSGYRRAKARIGNPPHEVFGMVRPLGIQTYDQSSLRAAADAMDSRAGELLVFFPEFGFGGFIPDETISRQISIK